MATMLVLSTLTLGLSAMNTLIIRDAAIEAAQRAALAESPSQKEYLLRLLDERLPQLASYQVTEIGTSNTVGYQVQASLPGLGFLPSLGPIVTVAAARESFS
jgi:hypothetical protein